MLAPQRNTNPSRAAAITDRDVPLAVKAEPVGDRAGDHAACAVLCKRLLTARDDRQIRARSADAAGPIAADDDCCSYARAPLSERLETLRLEWGGSRHRWCR